jgi:hypothetical protein
MPSMMSRGTTTDRMGTGGRYLATMRAVWPVVEKRMITLAPLMTVARTADDASPSSWPPCERIHPSVVDQSPGGDDACSWPAERLAAVPSPVLILRRGKLSREPRGRQQAQVLGAL